MNKITAAFIYSYNNDVLSANIYSTSVILGSSTVSLNWYKEYQNVVASQTYTYMF